MSDLEQKVASLTVADVASMEPAKAQLLIERLDLEAGQIEKEKDELQRTLKAQRAAIKEQVRPLVARLDAISAVRLLLATRAPGQRLG